MSHKSFISYKNIFKELKSLLEEYNIEVQFKGISFMSDFEFSLMKAIREEFSESRLNGCYFHYVKAPWKKMRNQGLAQKKLIENAKIIVFACKIYPFILKDKRSNYIEDLYNYALSVDTKFNKFISYFKKRWEKSPFLNFEFLTNGDIINRTNNLVEAFHHKLNAAIEHPHPRLSILIEKLKEFSIEYYRAYISKLFNEVNNKYTKQNIYADIFNFIKSFLNK